MVDEYASHHARSQGKEMTAILPLNIDVNQASISFVYERCRLQRVIDTFAAKDALRDLVKLVVDERGKPVQALVVAFHPVMKQLRDVR
jgi:hypothetical protein